MNAQPIELFNTTLLQQWKLFIIWVAKSNQINFWVNQLAVVYRDTQRRDRLTQGD